MGTFSRDPDDDDDDQGGGLLESRGFVLSAIVLGAVVVCGVAILLLGRGSDTPSATPTNTPTESVTTAPSQQPTGPPATPDPTDSESPGTPTNKPQGPPPCKRPASEEGYVAAPAGVSWDFVDGMLVPYRDSLGAGITDPDGLRHCFHRSPAGAAVAALTTIAQAQDPRHLTAVVKRRVMPGAGQVLAIAEARRVLATPSLDTGRNTIGQGQYVGYKVIDYTPSKAVLSIALQVDEEHVGGIVVALVWSDGDWKIQLRPDGQLGPDPDVLASLDGYIRFRGA